MALRRGRVYSGKLGDYPADRWLVVSEPVLTSALAVPLRQDVSPGEMEQLPNAELASVATYLVPVSKDYTAICYRITFISEEQLTDDGWSLRRQAMAAVEVGLRAVLSLPEPN